MGELIRAVDKLRSGRRIKGRPSWGQFLIATISLAVMAPNWVIFLQMWASLFFVWSLWFCYVGPLQPYYQSDLKDVRRIIHGHPNPLRLLKEFSFREPELAYELAQAEAWLKLDLALPQNSTT